MSFNSEVWFLVDKATAVASVLPVEKLVNDALDILMKNAKSVVRVPPVDIKNKKSELFNDILSLSKVVSPRNCLKSFE